MKAHRQQLGCVAVLVRDYDEAKTWYAHALGFEVVEDTPLADGKRWVLLRPPGGVETCLLLAKATTLEQAARVGDQPGRRVFLFLHTDDFARDHAAMRARRGVLRGAARGELRHRGRVSGSLRQPLGYDPASNIARVAIGWAMMAGSIRQG